MEFVGVALFARNHSAVTCADGVNEDQIGFFEEGVFVVYELVGRPWRAVILCDGHAARPQNAKVEPNGGGAGAAIEGEGQRPLA